MAEIFNFYVQDNRSIQFPKNNLLEPIMQEDYKVATWRFRIPKTLNGIDMSGWAWWFVYVNARGQEFSELLTLVDDIDEPDSFCTADYSIDYGISYHPGNFQFSLEAINADSGGEVLNEWHTKTYAHKVDKTLQGNQVQWSETESDIISALIVEVQNKVRQLVGGATPEPKSLIADMTDTKKVYLYVGSETGESTNYWYYYNGSAWVAGGLYASGITVDSVPTQGSNNAVSSGGVYSALQNINTGWNATAINLLDQIGDYIAFTSPTGGQLWDDLIDELQNSTPATMYAVTWSGSNYTASNSATSVREGRGYECTVSPNEGYVISAMTVMMGDTAITSTVSEGVYSISIVSVTGNISISVTTQADTSDIMFHVENLVCDGTQSPIETPLQFSSNTANGVTNAWSLCARAKISDAGGNNTYVFAAGSAFSRLSLRPYNSATNTRLGVLFTNKDLGVSMINKYVPIVITHEAGSNNILTWHYIDSSDDVATDTWTATNAVAYLSANNEQTPLVVGAYADGTNAFIGLIDDVTIYNRILTTSEISAYLTGGESA